MDALENTAHSTSASTDEEPPHIYEFTAIYGSYYVLSDRLYLYIITLLSAAWLFAQLSRYVARDLNAGCWYAWDAFGLVMVALVGQKQQWALACIFTASFFVWTRLPSSPFDSLRLRSFNAFLETSTRRSTANSKISEAADSQPDCIVCWSSDETPATLPCNHLICRDCLTSMRDHRQTQCPMCRYQLFHVNEGMQVVIHKASAAALAGMLAAKAPHLVLQLWHGQYWDAFTSSVTYPLESWCFQILRTATLANGLDWWRVGLFGYLLPIPALQVHLGRSAWPAAVFAFLCTAIALSALIDIGELDLVLDKVVHRNPLPEF